MNAQTAERLNAELDDVLSTRKCVFGRDFQSDLNDSSDAVEFARFSQWHTVTVSLHEHHRTSLVPIMLSTTAFLRQVFDRLMIRRREDVHVLFEGIGRLQRRKVSLNDTKSCDFARRVIFRRREVCKHKQLTTLSHDGQ